MTAPRQVLPGTTYLVTRRCSERRFFLKPSRLTNEIFLFVLAVAARRYGVHVHAFCALSNHHHLLLTDPYARLPAFMQYLGSLVARATNASLGRWEGFWASGASYSAVSLASPDDVVRKAAYVLANPVAARLVRDGDDWPGVRTSLDEIGAATIATPRPKGFFRQKGQMPESAQIALAVPPGFSSAKELQERVAAALAELEAIAKSEVASGKRGFLGRARVLAQNPFARPATAEPRRNPNPRVAGADKWKRIEALARLTDFLRQYRSAWKARRAGEPAVFPAGTYLLRFEPGVTCAGA